MIKIKIFFLYGLVSNCVIYKCIFTHDKKMSEMFYSDLHLKKHFTKNIKLIREHSDAENFNHEETMHSQQRGAISGKDIFYKFKRFYISTMPNIPFCDSQRQGSYPFISGDSFRRISHHVYDETNVEFDSDLIKDGDIVFVNTTFLDFFIKYEFDQIKNKFILVTHNSNISCPKNYLNILNNDKIIVWFGNNPDYYHWKFKALPLGLANPHWPHGNISIIKSVLNKKLNTNKIYLLIGNFALGTNQTSRKEVYDIFCKADYCTCFLPNKDYQSYLEDLSVCKFCLSPFGSGLDCHRMWEALLMGSYPITKTSSLDCLYEGLPVIIVNDWNEVNRDFLEIKYLDFLKQNFINEKIFFDYWKNLIFLTRSSYLNLNKKNI